MQQPLNKLIGVRLLVFGKFASASTSLITASISAALLLSLIHEVAFYINFDLNFISLLDATDYLKQSLFWAPFICISALFGSYEGYRQRREYEERRENAVILGDAHTLIGLGSERARYFFINVLPIFIGLITVSIFLPWPILFFTMPLIIILLIARYSETLLPKLSPIFFRVLLSIVAVMIFGALLGYIDGYYQTHHKEEKAKLYTRLFPQATNVYIIRYIDKGVICYTDSFNEIVFLPWSDVQKIEVPMEPNRSLFRMIEDRWS